MTIEEKLEKLNISYKKIEHKPVYTVDEAKDCKLQIEGIGCKNLFLKDKKGKYYLLLLPDDQRADFKRIEKSLSISHLTFAKEEELNEILHLTKGSVTPLGIMYDTKGLVAVIIEESLLDKKVLVHPNRNTATISISCDDLLRFIKQENHTYLILSKEERK